MTPREKIIIAAMGAVVVWAGATLLLDQRKKNGDAGVELTRQAVDAVKIAGQVRGQLAVARMTPIERAVLESARADWTGLPLDASRSLARARDGNQPPPFVYSGFVEAAGARFAIINGREYREGEWLDDGSGMIETVESGSVGVRFRRDGKRISIPFQESGKTRE